MFTAGMNYIPGTLTFSSNQPSSFVLAEDQGRPLPYIARSSYLIHIFTTPDERNEQGQFATPEVVPAL